MGKTNEIKEMAQLDVVTYVGQVWWLMVSVGGLYVVMEGEIVPGVSEIVKVRSKILKGRKIRRSKEGKGIGRIMR